VVGIFSIDWTLRRRPAQRVEHIEREKDIVDRARKIRGNAEREIHCIWCSMDYGTDLQKYFSEFRGIKPTVYRLVNVRKQGPHMVNHLEQFISEIKDYKYIVTSTRHEAFEFFVADKGELLLLIPHPTKYGICEGIYSCMPGFAYAVYQMYQQLAAAGNTLVIPAAATDAEASIIIREWVRSCSV